MAWSRVENDVPNTNPTWFHVGLFSAGRIGQDALPRHSMYAAYAYIGVVLGVNGAAYMAVPWSVWLGIGSTPDPSI